MTPAAAWGSLLVVLGAAACSRAEPPSAAHGGAHAGETPALPVASAPQPPPAPPSSVAADEPAASAEDGPYLSGGTWVSCSDGFRLASTLPVDLLRLGTLCGPYHGMKRLGQPLQGTLRAGEPQLHRFEAKRDQCFRAFAVWEPELKRLGLRALGQDGKQLASAEAAGTYGALRPDGVFCVQEAGAVQLELTALEGHGAFALQVWLLP